jgi:hypothetical protein
MVVNREQKKISNSKLINRFLRILKLIKSYLQKRVLKSRRIILMKVTIKVNRVSMITSLKMNLKILKYFKLIMC